MSSLWQRSAALSAVLVLVLATQFGGCGDDESPTGGTTEPAAIVLTDQVMPSTGCKAVGDFETIGTMIPYDECLRYTYGHDKTLRFIHENATFNCCLDSVSVKVTRSGNVITICCRQMVHAGGCDCTCLYDLTYGIDSIEPGQYRIKIFDPYHCSNPGYPKIEFMVDLAAIPHGVFCVSRYVPTWE